MNTLSGYSKSTLTDNFVLSAAGGHLAVGNAANNIPLNNNTVNTNLNADKLDGYHFQDIINKVGHIQRVTYKNGASGFNQTNSFWVKVATINKWSGTNSTKIRFDIEAQGGSDSPQCTSFSITRSYDNTTTNKYRGIYVTQHASSAYSTDDGCFNRVIVDSSNNVWLYYGHVWENQSFTILITARANFPEFTLLSQADAQATITTTAPTPVSSTADFTFDLNYTVFKSLQGSATAYNITAVNGFYKKDSSNDYVLLGAGGHKLITDLIKGGYIGTTQVQPSSKEQSLTGIGNISMSGKINNVFKVIKSQGAALLNIEEVTTTINYSHIYVSSTNDTATNSRPLVLQVGYGNVGVGTSSPSAKFHVKGTSLFEGQVNIYGNASDKPLIVRNIVGSNGSGTVDSLYLQYGANSSIHLGNTGAYTISADGSTYSGTATNADKLDGYHASHGDNKPWGTIPVIHNTGGWMDIGKQLEFHYDNTTGSDYSTVLRCTGNYSNNVALPSTSGTLALTTDIKWANLAGKPTTLSGYGITDALKNYKNDASRPNGTTFTLPGGANVVSTRSGATSGNDVGIFYLSDDNSFICNSSDAGYLFATFDTDQTADFSSSNNAAFAVLSSNTGVSMKGSLLTERAISNNDQRFNSGLCYYDVQSASVTGTIVIALPKSWTNSMNTYEIDLYEYIGYDATSNNIQHSKIIVDGYNYSEGYWVNYGYKVIGSYDKGVRLGYNGSKCAIMLGTTTTTWRYPKVYLSKVYSGHSGTAGWQTGASISLITSESGYSAIVTADRIRQIYNDVVATTFRGSFKRAGSDNTYVLLGGGDHKALSDFSMAHNHPYLPLSGGWMDTGAQIYFKGLNQSTSVWGSIGYRAHSGNGSNAMHTVTTPNNTGALYITTNGYDSANDYGGLAIDNDGVTAFGAGDSGSVFRVINEDNVADGAQFYVTKASGTVVKRSLTASSFVSNVATGTQPYACTSTTLNTNLNADLLDGIDSTEFFRKLGTNADINTYADNSNNNGILYINTTTPETINAPFSYGSILSLSSGAASWMIACSSGGNLSYRHRWWSQNGNSWSTWHTLLTSNNSSVSGGGSAGGSSITVKINSDSKTLTIPTSLPASDVYSWAKASSKPSYTFTEIGAGVATIGDGTNRIMWRTNSSYVSGLYYSTPGNESVVFANKNSVTSWIFATTDPTSRSDWKTLTPSLQIKNGRVVINKLIADGTNASYNLDVNGSFNTTSGYINGNGIIHAGNIGSQSVNYATSAGSAEYIYSHDTRNTTISPNTYGNGFRCHFQANGTNGINDGGNFYGLLHIKHYGNKDDHSGGYPHQLAFTPNANIWYRIGTGASSWGTWNKILTSKGGEVQGQFAIVGQNSGAASITADLDALVIACKQTRAATANYYYPGIAFNHMWNWDSAKTYQKSPQAWIGLKLHSTPGSELSYLVFATKSSSGASDRPAERMRIAPDGTITATGSIYAAHFYENSDAKLKENIQKILNSDNIPQIKEFDWKEDNSHSYGLIAQELEEQGYSELVSTKDDGHKTVNYSAALSLIVGKLQVKIKELEKEIENLKNKN